MKNLRVLCLFSEKPSRGNNGWAQVFRDQMVEILALKLSDHGIHLHYVHLVMRNPEYTASQWEKIEPTLTFHIGDKLCWEDYTKPVPKIRTVKKRATLVTELPLRVKDDLEAMGGGRRLGMSCVLKDTLGPWYHRYDMEEVLKRKWKICDEEEEAERAVARAKALVEAKAAKAAKRLARAKAAKAAKEAKAAKAAKALV